MKVTFYKYYKGSYVQLEEIDKVKNMTKAELFKIAELRHPILTRREYFNVLTTDDKGSPKKEFTLSSSNHFLVVKKL